MKTKQIEVLSKYLPEERLNDILNFQRIVDYVCNKFEITEDELSGDSKKPLYTHARLILVSLTVKILNPKIFEANVFNGDKLRISKYLTDMIKIAVNKSYTMPKYYIFKLRTMIETKEISIESIKEMELEVLGTFEYLD